MARIWIVGTALVTVIAALKTFLVHSFVLTEAEPTLALLTGLFAVFFALTATVAYVTFTQLRTLLEAKRRTKLAPGASEPVAKESVILQYAPEWGLSQAEADVAIFVAKGFSNSEIAEMRGSAITTVKSQLGRIYQKSGLDSRYQLIAFVTDEVVATVKQPDSAVTKIPTRKVLPLVTRTRKAA
ncbi:hypothetical protein HKCCE4037_09425 [Rhodobacterales bacterium HKCCE4037]|nr:hypothetical protein [Rhodobacterales bacterium HKCCE4037]